MALSPTSYRGQGFYPRINQQLQAITKGDAYRPSFYKANATDLSSWPACNIFPGRLGGFRDSFEIRSFSGRLWLLTRSNQDLLSYRTMSIISR